MFRIFFLSLWIFFKAPFSIFDSYLYQERCQRNLIVNECNLRFEKQTIF